MNKTRQMRDEPETAAADRDGFGLYASFGAKSPEALPQGTMRFLLSKCVAKKVQVEISSVSILDNPVSK
jgi:hypothetical protein